MFVRLISKGALSQAPIEALCSISQTTRFALK
jgi:hypothetical protein